MDTPSVKKPPKTYAETPPNIGVIIHLLSTMDIPVGLVLGGITKYDHEHSALFFVTAHNCVFFSYRLNAQGTTGTSPDPLKAKIAYPMWVDEGNCKQKGTKKHAHAKWASPVVTPVKYL